MLNDGDKAECKEIAREIVKEVLIEHTVACPHGIRIGKLWMLLLGASIGGATGGGGIVAVVMHFVGA